MNNNAQTRISVRRDVCMMMGENRANINANANELKWLLNAMNSLMEFIFFFLFLWFFGACMWRIYYIFKYGE